MSSSARHVRKNRRHWDGASDEYQTLHARQLNRFDRAAWGVWGIPESRVKALGDVRGLDVLEYGCGAAQWSIWLARQGARPVGLDLSARQLVHASALMTRAGVRFPLVNADAERTPFRDEAFDLACCDHGAMTFADPRRTVPEVARVLRPGGRFVFNMSSAFHYLCWDDDAETVSDHLERDYFGMHSWDEESVDFQLPYGEWIRLFRANGLQVEDLIELRPPANARTSYPWFAPLEWARRFPAENVWKLSKRG
ncbi:MAG: class I SAM-dependent methyltransferase [Solirubrobacterales bacterium]